MSEAKLDRLNPNIKHHCGKTAAYSEKYDAYFCDICDVWLEAPCSDVDHNECRFDCENRPDMPSRIFKSPV